MATAASTIIGKAATILKDQGYTRWTQTELLNWLNDGQAFIVSVKPNACVVNDKHKLISGTKQSIPDGRVALIEVVRNLGTDGATPGKSIRLVDRDALDSRRPGWHSETPVTAVKHYTFSDADPKHFYTYPPSDGTGYVETVCASSPTPCSSASSVISVDDIYEPTLINYVLFRAYSKDADSPINAQKALAYSNLVTTSLGLKAQAEYKDNPNVRANVGPSPSATPTAPGGVGA
jgi:hypothetical protein